MRKLMGYALLLGSALAAVGPVVAQGGGAMGPPKVLVITREFVKPGKSGPPHAKTESAFVNAMAAANWPQHYFAMDSLTGPSRSLFLVGYDSFEAWEKDNRATEKNTSLSAALSRAAVADGELLTAIETSAFAYREEMSFQAGVDIAKMRYFDISRWKVRPGHDKDWEAIVKLYKDGYSKAVPDAHWAIFEDTYGKDSGGSFIVISPMKSLSEVDKGFGDSKKFVETMGEEGMKKLSDLMAASTDMVEENLFAFNPAESYPSPEWIKSDPDFWKTNAPAPAKKAEKKPAE
jgi:hypothetical protein